MTDWKPLISQAIEKAIEKRNEPIPGAAFKHILLRIAENEELPDGKFSNFLAGFPDQITIIQREGQDILITPAGRPELIKTTMKSERIRQDLFKAFTDIRVDITAWYCKTDDTITYLDRDVNPGDDYLLIPSVTFESEKHLRQKFSETQHDDTIRRQLQESLNNDFPLKQFSSTLRQVNKFKEWYEYRLADTKEAIVRWAQTGGVDYGKDWFITEKATPVKQINRIIYNNNFVGAAINSLDISDLSRIMVPLDIVVKLMKNKTRA